MSKYYELWIDFKNNVSNIDKAEQRVLDLSDADNRSSLSGSDKEQKQIVNSLFNGFCNTHGIPGNDINDCILLEFPLKDIVPLLEQFVENSYNIELDGCIQLTKLIYYLWPKYMTQTWFNYNKHYPHGAIFELLQSIKFKLGELEKVSKSIPFPSFTLLGCIPLLENGEQIMWNVIQMRYDNAQEMLIFGLSQFDPVKYLPTLGKVFRYWNTHGNIDICSGTGIFGDIINLAHHYKKRGVDIYSNSDIFDIFKHSIDKYTHNIYAEPECYKSWHFWDK
jgi:hypothetical protein